MKVFLFLALPAVFSFFNKDIHLNTLFNVNKSGMKLAFMLCIPVFCIVLGGYMLLRNVFDFSAVTTVLTGNIGVNRNNFIYVAIYISFVNSLLEEFFFRGFAFITLKEVINRKFAYAFSAALFSLYHVGMTAGWFHIVVFVLAFAGLFVGGLIFNYLNEKCKNIYPSWLVHMCANFAINTIGFILFGIM